MELRPSGPHEAAVLADVHAATARIAYAHIFGDRPFPLDLTRQRYASFCGRIIVADECGRVVGFAAAREQELCALYVLPEFWDRGVGHRLLDAVAPVRVLWVLEANARGRRFYERHGWRPDGSVKIAFGARELCYRLGPDGPNPSPVLHTEGPVKRSCT